MTELAFKLWLESKQDIISLGYPAIIASLMSQKFGKYAFLLAKWYRDYCDAGRQQEDWFKRAHSLALGETKRIGSLIKLYDATKDADTYKRALADMDINTNQDYDGWSLEQERRSLKTDIEDTFFKETFFSYFNLPNDIANGKLKDVAPYKDLTFRQAEEKYNKRQIFSDREPIKRYPNGYKWIDVGRRCYLIGNLMKNCGSAGVMSGDENRTMLVLFDKNNKPHVVVTYSPNEKRISGDQGKASSEVKSNYHDYIIDLADTLGVTFSVDKSKSTLLKVKYLLRGKIQEIQRLKSQSIFDEYFVFTANNGGRYYTNGNLVLSDEDLAKLKSFPFKIKTGSLVGNAFNHRNLQDTYTVVKYVPIEQF